MSEVFESYEFASNTEPPAVLHTCKESRAIALTHYCLSFGTSYTFTNLKISTPPSIFINWDCDRICLLWPHQFNTHKSRCFKTFVQICRENKLRYIALNVLREAHWPFVDLTTKIHSLKEVLLFGSAAPSVYGYHEASTIDFIEMKDLAAEFPELWKDMRNHSWPIRLEVPRRDLATFFQLHMHKLQEASDFDSSLLNPPADTQDEVSNSYDQPESWEPPKIEIAYITMDGKPETSHWDW